MSFQVCISRNMSFHIPILLSPGVPHGLAAHRLRHGGGGERQGPPCRADAERIFTGDEPVKNEGPRPP